MTVVVDRSVRVVLSAAIADFDRAMQQAATAADQVRKSVEGVDEAQKKVRASQGQAWADVSTTMVKAGAAGTALVGIIAKSGIEYNTLQQRSRAALTTILQGSEAANAQMDKLDAFARTSPFAKQVFIEAQQQMLGFGIETQKVIPYLSAIQDTTAAVGGNNVMIAELSRIMSQISATAKITATDLREFGNRGVDAATIIGSRMGMTGAEIRESITAGTLDAQEALDALAAGMTERFGGAAAGVKDTFEGAMDRVKAAWRDLTATILSGAVDPQGGGWLIDLTNQAADFMRILEDLPDGVLSTGTAIAGITSVSLLATGGLMKLTTETVKTRAAFAALRTEAPLLSGAIGKITTAAKFATAALVAIEVVKIFAGMHEGAQRDADEMVTLLDQIATGAATIDDAFRSVDGKALADDLLGAVETVYDLDSALNALSRSWMYGSDGKMFLWDTEMSVALDTFKQIDEALTAMPVDEAAAAFSRMWDEMAGRGMSAEEILGHFPEFAKEAEQALAELSNELGGPVYNTADAVAELMSGKLPAGLVATADGFMTVRQAAESGVEVYGTGAETVARYAEEIRLAALDAELGATGWTRYGQAVKTGSEDAVDAYLNYVSQVGSGSAGFIDITGALDATIQKEKDAAQAAADASKSKQDSWEDFYDGVSFTLEGYLESLEEQVAAQEEWETNMLLLTGRASQGLLDYLAQLGPEGAPLVAALVDASEEEMARMEAGFREGGEEATDAFGEALINAEHVWAALAAVAGDAAVEAARQEFAEGKKTLQEIVEAYDLSFIIDADTTRAIDKARIAAQRIREMRPTMTVDVYQNVRRLTLGQTEAATGGRIGDLPVRGLAGGGRATDTMPILTTDFSGKVTGPGTTTSDEALLTALSREEFVLRAWAAQKIGYDNLYYMNRTGQLPERLANGGRPTAERWQASQQHRIAAPSIDTSAIADAARQGTREGLSTARFVMDGKIIDVRVETALSDHDFRSAVMQR